MLIIDPEELNHDVVRALISSAEVAIDMRIREVEVV